MEKNKICCPDVMQNSVWLQINRDEGYFPCVLKHKKTKRYFTCIYDNQIKTTPYIEYAFIQNINEAKMFLEIKKLKNFEIKKIITLEKE